MPSTRRTFLASLASAGLVATAGCSVDSDRPAYRSYGYGPHNRNTTTGSGPTDDVDASWRIEDAARFQVPAVVDGQVFIATQRRDGSVVAAIDAETGEQDWEYDAGAPIRGWRPAVVDGTLYFVDRSGRAHAVDTADGTEQWHQSLPVDQGVSNSPVVVDGALVFGLGDLALFEFGGLYALETSDGSVRWHRSPASDAEPPRSHTPVYPAAADSTVFYASLPGQQSPQVTAVDAADGSPEWKASPTDEAAYTGVAVTDDRLYLGGAFGQTAIDRESRELEWHYEGGGLFAPPTVADGRAFAIGQPEGGGTVGVNAIGPDGSTHWSHTVEPVSVAPSAPAVAEGAVYYGGADGRLYALDAADGSRLWRFGTEMAGFRTPVVVDGTVYAASSRGLVALTAG